MEEGNSVNRQSCAACRYQRRRCSKDICVLYPYFPASLPEQFSAALKVFGVSNMTKMIGKADPGEQRNRIAKSLLWEAEAWRLNPTDGPLGLYEALKRVNQQLRELVDGGRQQTVPPGEVVANYGGSNRGSQEFSMPAVSGCSDLAVQNTDGYSSSLCSLPREVRRESISRGKSNQIEHSQGNESRLVVNPNDPMVVNTSLPLPLQVAPPLQIRNTLSNGTSTTHAYRGQSFDNPKIMNSQQNQTQEFSQSFGNPNITNAQQDRTQEFSRAPGWKASTSQATALSLVQQPNCSWNSVQFGSQTRPLYPISESLEQCSSYMAISQRQPKSFCNAAGNYQAPGSDLNNSGIGNPYFMRRQGSLTMNQGATFYGSTLPVPNMATERTGASSRVEANLVLRHPNHQNDQQNCRVQVRIPSNGGETNSIQFRFGSPSATPGLLGEVNPIPNQAIRDQATPELVCTQGNSFPSMHYSSTSQEQQICLPTDHRTPVGCENRNTMESQESNWYQ